MPRSPRPSKPSRGLPPASSPPPALPARLPAASVPVLLHPVNLVGGVAPCWVPWCLGQHVGCSHCLSAPHISTVRHWRAHGDADEGGSRAGGPALAWEFGGPVPPALQSPCEAGVITCHAGGETEALSSSASERVCWAGARQGAAVGSGPCRGQAGAPHGRGRAVWRLRSNRSGRTATVTATVTSVSQEVLRRAANS